MNAPVKDKDKEEADAVGEVLLESSYCTKTEDFFAQPARDLISRYLSSFLDQLVITPAELVHSAKYQKRLNDAGRVQMNTVDKIGSLQARFKGESQSKRVRELQTLVSQANRKVWDDDRERPVASLKPENFGDVVHKIPPDSRDYEGLRILTDHLGQYKVWKEKATVLVYMMAHCRQPQAWSLIEAVLGETMRSEPALDQLLGMPERLEVRCNDLIDLWKGCLTPRDTTAPVITDINNLIAADKVPSVKAGVEFSLFRSLAGRMPLRSAEPDIEILAVNEMFKRMWHNQTLLGGAKGMAMLEKRQTRGINTETVTDLLRDRKVLIDRLLYLMELTTLAVGPANRAILKTFIDHYFGDRDFIPRVASGQEPPVPKLQTFTTLHKAIRNSWLTEDEKSNFAALVEASQAKLIVSSHLFEQIDKKGGGPAQKVLTIIDLCRKGTFIDGRNHDPAKRYLMTYLQDPAFMAEYLAGTSGEERARKVDLLVRTLASLGINWTG